MKNLSRVALLLLITILVWGQAGAQGKPSALPNLADGLASRFYEQVVARQPIGMPSPADMKIFAPYLSKELRHKIDLSIACIGDWGWKNPGPHLKPPSVLIENGLFSGANEEAEPKAFHIERTESGNDGTSRVYVRLVWGNSPEKSLIWYVAAVVVPENGRLVVDDVLYLKNKKGDVDARLSEDLSLGCSGANWVGRPG